MSIASPLAFSLLMSIRTISEQVPATAKVYAQVAPTLPAPRIVIFFPPLLLAIKEPPINF